MSEYRPRTDDTFEGEDLSYEDDRRIRDDRLEAEVDPELSRDYGDGSAAGSTSAEHRTRERVGGRFEGEGHLFDPVAAEEFRQRWSEIQTSFVDEPREAVEEADALVGEVTDRLTEMFTSSRDDLERQWSAGKEASTEDLRLALQRYRTFFDRLLSV